MYNDSTKYHCVSDQRISLENRGFTSPCWIWQLSTLAGGYGSMWHQGKTVNAHRIYYERAYGPIPAGLELDHLCRVRNCVNPEHLEAVTRLENMRRVQRVRKLNPQQEREVSRRYSQGGITHRQLAKLYNVSRATIMRACKRSP